MSPSETPTRDEFYESLLGDFLDESAQLLDRLNENLLRLDEWVQSYEGETPPRCDEELLHELFRAAHSLKGLSAMLGLQDINQLTHKVENVFDAARKDQLPITRDVVNLIFEAVDRLGALVAVLKEPEKGPVDYEPVLEKIQQVLQACGAERKVSTQADAERALAAVEQGLAALQSSENNLASTVSPPAAASPLESKASGEEMATSPGPTKTDLTGPTGVPPRVSALGPSPQESSAEIPEDVLKDIEDDPNVPSNYVGLFVDEAEESLDQLSETLLAAEGAEEKLTLEKLLVYAHKVKGSAATVGLHRAAKLAHLMEDIVQGLLAHSGTFGTSFIDLLLRGTDALRQFVQSLREGRPLTEHFGPVARDLLVAQRSLLASQPIDVPATGVSIASTVPEQGSVSGTPVSTTSKLGFQPSSREMQEIPAGGQEASARKTSCSPSAETSSVNASWRAQVMAKIPEGSRAILGEVYFEPGLPLVGLKGRLIYEKLCHLGEVCQFDPLVESLDEMEHLEKVSFGLLTEKTVPVVESHLRIAGVCRMVLEPWPTPTSSPDQTPTPSNPSRAERNDTQRGEQASSTGSASVSGAKASTVAQPSPRPPMETPSSESSAKPTETLRVDIERLDQLMNYAGQLVINKAQFTRIGDNLKNVFSGKNPLSLLERIATALREMGQQKASCQVDAQVELEAFRATARRLEHDVEELRKEIQSLPRARQSVNELQEAIHQLDRVTDGLQHCVMQTRMVPIGPLFARFKRVVRDITRLNGKSAQLVILGEKTELDKRMIDELGDPLIHMVRNAVDHGIEPPEVRESLGKPRQGTITLEAFHRGNSIVIRVSDDGRGLDAEKILRKALEKGLVSPADAEKMTRQQIYQLIWQPGLSTAEKVTEVSGRGMGMDIVLSKISDLNGVVEIDSTPGAGTTMTIKLPLTLAILPSLMIEIDGDTFALPIEAVVEIVHLNRSNMYTIQGHWTARVRDAMISVVHLSDIFTWNQPGATGSKESAETTLVILGDTGRQIGLAVNRVLGEEDVVIKSISENYHNVPGIAGASILGDGRVALILDVAALVEMASGRHSVGSC